MFKCEKKLRVIEYDDYENKDGKVIEQVVLGDVERFLRFTFRLPVGMPKPKIGDMVYITIDLKEYNSRLYPVLVKVE